MEHPSARALSEHIVVLLTADPGTAENVKSECMHDSLRPFGPTETSVKRGYARMPHARLTRPVLFVLCSPRSGSSLLQLSLQVHRKLFAGWDRFRIRDRGRGRGWD